MIGSTPFPGSIDARALEQVRTKFVKNVYAWMAGGLGITAATSLMVAMSPTLLMSLVTNPILFFGLILCELGLVIWLSTRINKMSVQTASWAFLAYSVLNGVTISFIFLAYTAVSITTTFLVAAGMFAATAVYGTVTKKDLTSMGSLAFMGLIGIIIASVANMFLAITALDWIISYVGVAVFLGLTAYDAQKIQRIGLQAAAMGSETLSKQAIMGALALYLDFINLFLFLLRIFGDRR